MSKEGRCGQGRQVLGTDLTELCKPKTRFHLEQAAGGPEQGETFHTLPTLASVLTLVRTLSPRSHNLQTCASSQYGPLVHSFTWSLKL